MDVSEYRLSPGAYFCLADEYLVFSDIDKDKYYCLSPQNTQAFLSWLTGLKQLEQLTDCTFNSVQAHQIVLALGQQGLLVEGERGASRSLQAVDIPAPASQLDNHNTAASGSNSGRADALRFLYASLRASYKLRLHPFHAVLRAVEERRLLARRTGDPETLAAAANSFSRLRPYYPRAYLCRFDSLALIEFLASCGHYPLWVFGVKTKPFGAHCWVQEDNVVLNDQLDYVKRFTRIMAF